MKIFLNNAQGTPSLIFSENGDELCRVYFCKDGGIIQTNKVSIGTRIGCRDKQEQSNCVDAAITDEIEIKSRISFKRLMCDIFRN